MVSHVFQIKPFTTSNGCGDFVYTIERENDFLFVLGDVGGHGNLEVGTLAKRMREWINDNHLLSIKALFEGLNKIEGVETFGASIFLGRVDTSHPGQPLLHYICIGDIRAMKLGQSSVKSLPSQQGIMGVAFSSSVKEFVTNLNAGEGVIVASDGVSLSEKAFSGFPKEPIDKACERIMSQSAKKDDDASCILLKMEGGRQLGEKKAHFQTQILSKPNIDLESASNHVLNRSVEKEKLTQHSSTSLMSETYEPVVVPLPAEDSFFCVFDALTTARQKIDELNNYFLLNNKQGIALKSLALEAISELGADIHVNVSKEKLFFSFPYQKVFEKRAYLLMSKAQVGISPCGEWLIICMGLPSSVDITSIAFAEFRERVQLGISQENYEQYQQDQKRDVVLTQQAKLASMGEMIGAIAHQWRQPLNELALRIQTLRYRAKQGLTDEDISTFIKENLVTIDFMSKTVDDFRNFFRIDKSKEIFDVSETIESVVELQKAQLLNNGIKVLISGETCDVEGFKSEFQQVILNVIGNARDALNTITMQEKVIDIVFELNKISITDNAGGVPIDVMQRIFEPYFTTKAHGEGTGMGLYMSKMIIEDHMQGTIDVKNVTTHNGKGAEFTITLPLIDTPRNTMSTVAYEMQS
ncbi:ATP-binding protein [Alteromonas gracilis]|uniref:ATP-binding protein n=1 Tax=Alteromonas gracilis TaxID=1479524 RepID=UPI0037363DF6